MGKDDVKAIKKELIEMLCSIKQEVLNDIRKHSERVIQEAIEAPGRMQSRYDSSKQELGYLANSLENRIAQLKQEIAVLKSQEMSNIASDEIGVCSLAEIAEGNKSNFYFIFSVGGGEKIKSYLLGKEIKIINPSSPLGAALMGKAAGESIFLGQRTLTIISVF